MKKKESTPNVANSTQLDGSYQDIPLSFVSRVAAAMAEGRLKHEQDLDPWDKNYYLGNKAFIVERLGHLVKHVFELREQILADMEGRSLEPTEDHLGHAGANLLIIAELEHRGVIKSTKV